VGVGRCDVSIDGSQSGFMSSFWRSRKLPKNMDQLQGTLRKGTTVMDTVHGRCGFRFH
jgi:hypothetical protein